MLGLDNKTIVIFFSQKSDGDMLFKTRTSADLTLRQSSGQARTNADRINERVKENRLKFFAKNNIDPARLVNLAGVHGADIATFTCESTLGGGALDPTTRILETDGLITNVKKSYLMVTGADCFPVLFYDEVNQTIGAAHAGWRGLIKADLRGLNADQHGQKQETKGIAEEMIYSFKNEFGSKPPDINVWIGPGIKKCHYDVPKERAELFSKDYKNHIIEKGGKIFLDLPKIIMVQLTALGVNPHTKRNYGVGVNPAKIIEHPDCTFCEKDKWFSYRRDKPEYIESQAFIIHLI